MGDEHHRRACDRESLYAALAPPATESGTLAPSQHIYRAPQRQARIQKGNPRRHEAQPVAAMWLAAQSSVS
jgi:hypothetical protein